MDNEIVNVYKVRKLKTFDIYPMSKILKKMNLKLNVADITKNIDLEELKKEDNEGKMIQAGLQAMIQIGFQVAENLHLAQEEVSEFMGSMVGMSAKEFNELDIEETVKIMAQFTQQKGVASFLNSAGSLRK